MKSIILSILILVSNLAVLHAQIYPVSFNERVVSSNTIAIATVKSKEAYWDQNRSNIYTLNVLEVQAFLKGQSSATEVAMITMGGRVNDKLQKTFPSTSLDLGKQYVVMLDRDNYTVDNKSYRFLHPNTPQCNAAAEVQGVLPLIAGKYHDTFREEPYMEEELMSAIQLITGDRPRRPNGTEYEAQDYSARISNNRDAFTITSIEDGTGTMAPGPFVAGTIDTDNELVISASGGGFGATRGTGTVEFENADDGGATWTPVVNASDYVSWSDTEIRVKIPRRAGTGNVRVTDDAGSTDTYSSITIDWAVIPVDSDFFNWGADNRNRIELIDDNGSGGYTLEYSTVGGMASNMDAMDAFERALTTWRCDSGVNFEVSGTSTGTGFGDDGTNVVMFASLSGSTLGRATSRFTANGSGGCDMEDTFWRLDELDIQFDSGTSWYYGSGACSGTTYDFESVAVHELGHGHGLGHVIDASKVMHYAIGTCDILTTLSTAESAAGSHKMTHSTASNCLGPANGLPGPMTSVPGASCSLLPVELIAFSGQRKGDAVELTWETASELDNDFFTLERSIDGRNFEAIAFVQGAVTTYHSEFYTYIDQNPALGTNYYRLRQTDFDGTEVILDKIVSVEFERTEKISIQPNPVQGDQISVFYHANQDGELQIEIYDVTGQLHQQFTQVVSSDQNAFDLAIAQLGQGIYILRSQLGNSVHSLRFVKTK